MSVMQLEDTIVIGKGIGSPARNRPQATSPSSTIQSPAMPRVVRRVRTKKKAESAAAELTFRAVGFVCIAWLAFMASGLAGQLMLEQARREHLAAAGRCRVATRDEALLRAKLDEMTSASKVEEWATAHGYVAADANSITPSIPKVPQSSSSLLARR